MKKIITLIIVCLIASVATYQAAAEEARPEELAINTATISQIEFDTASGTLSFTVDGKRHALAGRSIAGGPYDLSVAANLAILNELRHAAKATLWVYPSTDSQQARRLAGITFNYDSLK